MTIRPIIPQTSFILHVSSYTNQQQINEVLNFIPMKEKDMVTGKIKTRTKLRGLKQRAVDLVPGRLYNFTSQLNARGVKGKASKPLFVRLCNTLHISIILKLLFMFNYSAYASKTTRC